MYRHVLPYTVIEFRMYCLVPPCTEIDRKSTYWYVLLVIWRISVHTGMYRYIPLFAKPKSVHTALYYRRVHGGMYRYVPVYTAINQVYRIPDGSACQRLSDLNNDVIWSESELES